MRKKAVTSVIPYLRAKEKQAQEAAKVEAPAKTHKNQSKPPMVEEIDQYNRARLAILRGEE
jgi:hypothetical protein